ncbi:DNA polymerase ligase N-terminal domain-containing protein [Actinacidiphila rubida]|uniref:Bifunctional non-homologous end joining protein LigD n=1 Tax=Actinacidiphila rubida TaxID=310780 RepID=A0A1H8SPB3_9ACTN|nr:DNA polymerase ligase N-terminal domain-containing protein [Actinacidiphila rubida]SEO80481.1 bifunctional non-homologous end joining protein LigD [Actinacidiphila rubida]
MAERASLAEYHRRRDFSRTGEPEGGDTGPAADRSNFVVQIHDATTTHFDFRLEVEGVLKSWAVPKGPSADPHDKRLAMPTEDHPLEYRDFEGIIAQGEYGAGAVIIWDEGTYRNITEDRRHRPVPFAEALENGHVSFWLDGSKLHGGYSLTRIRNNRYGDRDAWLLVKRGDSRASHGHTPDPRRARSARSGHTLGQVAAEGGPTWTRGGGS